MRKKLSGVVASILLSGVLLAETDRKQLVVTIGDVAAAHVADGEGWSTTFALVNMGASEQSGVLLLFKSGGVPLYMDFQEFGRTFSVDFTIPPHGTFTAKTKGTASTVSTGFAIMLLDDVTSDQVGGSTVFGYSVPGVLTLEAAVPFSNVLYKKGILFFDHRDGYASGVALVNPLTDTRNRVRLVFYGQDGTRILSETLTMQPMEHTSFMLSDRFPELDGEAGSVVITSTSGGVLILGLRANPTGPFTTLFPMLTIDDVLDSLD